MDNNLTIDTGIDGTDDTDYLQFTPEALAALKQSIADNKVPETYFLRIKSSSGGCSGMHFSLEFDYNYDEFADRELSTDGLRIVADNKTIFYLMGITIDYVDDEDMGGFIFQGYRDYPTCGGCSS